MKLRLHTKNHRWGIFRGERFIKLQLGSIRFYISTLPMKPKHESQLRRSFRREILERDGRVCAHCGRPLEIATLSVHHIKPRATHPELIYDADNCMALCKPCHTRLHQIQNRPEASIGNTVSVNPVMPTAAVLAMTE